MSDNTPEIVANEQYEYGRLWADGTFDILGWSDEGYARREFGERSYEFGKVPPSMRPTFARRRVVKTTEIYPAEAWPDARK